MAIHMLSEQTLTEAREMATQSHTWNRGRSKVNGREFWVIPSRTESNVAHYSTSYGCTCKGARRHGDCAHQEAVRVVEAEQARLDAEIDQVIADALGESSFSWAELRAQMPSCAAGCGNVVEQSNLLWCEDCGAARERSERLAAGRRKVLAEVMG